MSLIERNQIDNLLKKGPSQRRRHLFYSMHLPKGAIIIHDWLEEKER